MTDTLGNTDEPAPRLLGLTAETVAAFVGNNSLPVSDLPGFIAQVHAALAGLAGARSSASNGLLAPPPEPAVPIKKSVTHDYIVCLEDGHTFKSLKRHLRTEHSLSPEAYREKWDLPPDYPMVAAVYTKVRSELAKKAGLGHQRHRRKQK